MATKRVAVKYSPTPLEKTLVAPLRGMYRWSRRHGRKVIAEMRLMGA